jgi:hypothetical protein
MGPSSGDTTVFMQRLVLVVLYVSLSGVQGGASLVEQVWHKYSCIS